MRASVSMAGEDFARLRRQIAKIEANAWVKTRDDSDPRDILRTKDDPLPTSPFQREELNRSCQTPPYPNLRQTPPPERGRWGGGPLAVRDPVSGVILPPATIAGFSRAPPTLAPRRAGATLPFAIPKLDALLGGGLRRAALHELRTEESRNAAAMTGFAVALLARLAADDARPLLWIIEQTVGTETGLPYGDGLRHFGLDPSRLIVVRVRRPVDALWVFEEGIRCAGVAAVVTELSGNPRALDLTASRRLALRAAESGVTGLLLRPSALGAPGAASTRWRVSPLPSALDPEYPDGIGRPAWRLALERNRHGITGIFDVEWNHEQRSFAPARAAPAHPRPLASLPVDGSPPPPEQGKVVAAGGHLLPREEKRRHLRSRG